MNSILIINDLPIIPLPDTLANTSWVMWSIVVIILSLLFTFTARFNSYSERLKNLFKNKERTMNYSNAQSAAWIDGLLFITVLCSYAIFIYTQIRCIENNIPTWSIAVILVGVYIFYTLKMVVTKTIGYAFYLDKKTSLYINSYQTFIALLGVALIPLSIYTTYTFDTAPHTSLIIGSVLVVIILLLILFKLIQYFFQGFVSLLYIFLYLCSLEIIPLLLIINIVPKLLFLYYQ
ncbi:MAG: DUF4271 domain-containing protein [bacterium]